MTSTVPCPDCDRTATVLGRFTLPGPDGPAEFLRVRCAGPLTLLVPVAEVRQPVEAPGDRLRSPPESPGGVSESGRSVRRRVRPAPGRLGRLLAGLAPDEPEVHGLLGLMEIQAARAAARTGAPGEPVLLLEQDRARWDGLLIHRGPAALVRADELGGEPGAWAERVGRRARSCIPSPPRAPFAARHPTVRREDR
ncbi:MAG: hypothetical protein QOG20_4999 [Pseudonocardiales bacterium]|nr:hypothetical protein [Pseudonocardiales bacterium]